MLVPKQFRIEISTKKITNEEIVRSHSPSPKASRVGASVIDSGGIQATNGIHPSFNEPHPIIGAKGRNIDAMKRKTIGI